jgi:hypothetical protein
MGVAIASNAPPGEAGYSPLPEHLRAALINSKGIAGAPTSPATINRTNRQAD